jgi:hypothetical protein
VKQDKSCAVLKQHKTLVPRVLSSAGICGDTIRMPHTDTLGCRILIQHDMLTYDREPECQEFRV